MIANRRQDMQSKFWENIFGIAILLFISFWVILIS
jgi:hypothetical protein